MLARLAAGAHNSQSGDDEAAIEKYLRSVLSLENILTLDRLRQVRPEPSPHGGSGLNALGLLTGSGSEGAADEQRAEQQEEPEFSFSPQGKHKQTQPDTNTSKT